MQVRVYQPVDEPARVVHPNWDLFNPAVESAEAFFARVVAHTEAADPTLAGLPAVDVDHTALPAERTRVVDGKAIDVRQAWRVDGDVVAVAEDVVAASVVEAQAIDVAADTPSAQR